MTLNYLFYNLLIAIICVKELIFFKTENSNQKSQPVSLLADSD